MLIKAVITMISHYKKINELIFKRKGVLGKLRFLNVWQQTTRRPPDFLQKQISKSA